MYGGALPNLERMINDKNETNRKFEIKYQKAKKENPKIKRGNFPCACSPMCQYPFVEGKCKQRAS